MFKHTFKLLQSLQLFHKYNVSLSLSQAVCHGSVDRHVSQGVIFPARGQTLFRYHSPSLWQLWEHRKLLSLISEGNKQNIYFLSCCSRLHTQHFQFNLVHYQPV